VYFIFFFIDAFSFSPISCAENPDYVVAQGKANRYYPFTHTAYTIEALLGKTVIAVFDNHTTGIKKIMLGDLE